MTDFCAYYFHCRRCGYGRIQSLIRAWRIVRN